MKTGGGALQEGENMDLLMAPHLPKTNQNVQGVTHISQDL